MPNVSSPPLHPTIAKRKIESAGLRANMVGCTGPNCRVMEQDPVGGTLVDAHTIVTCHSDDITA